MTDNSDPRSDPSFPIDVSVPARGSARFQAVSVTRSYELVVRQIEDAIRRGDFKRGERLPTERELAVEFDVSRGVVREAIKVLNAMGLVEARQGSGLYVRNDPMPTVTRAFFLSVSPDAESVVRLFEFRRSLEIEAARFAAQRRTKAHLASMASSIDWIDSSPDPVDWDGFSGADDRFHLAIAEASGNPYLSVAIATARDMQRDVVNLFALHPGSIRAAATHHRSIMEAIGDRATDEAAQRMANHISYTADAVQNQIPTRSTPIAHTSEPGGE